MGSPRCFQGQGSSCEVSAFWRSFLLIGEYDSSDDVGHVEKIDSRILVMWSCDVACCRTEIWMRFRTTCVVPLPLKMAPCRAPWVTRPVNTRASASEKHQNRLVRRCWQTWALYDPGLHYRHLKTVRRQVHFIQHC